jgi:MOSC domain-containing protein
MAKQRIGSVAALWRYPVKSMLGEKLGEVNVTFHGVAGDRVWALRELASGWVVSAKKYPKLFQMRAYYDPAESAGSSPIRIALPDGATILCDDSNASETLSTLLGAKVRLEHPQPEQQNFAGIDPATVFADVPPENIFPGITNVPNSFPLPTGSFFDSAPIHVLASGTLQHMSRLAGGKSRFDPRRFRPNIYVETSGSGGGFVEDEWLGGMLEIGESARIIGMKPALRCVMTTHPQDNLERDYTILRTAAQNHQANVGVFASVGARGTVRVGDPVFLTK